MDRKYALWVKNTCPYCTKAVALLNDKKIDYVVWDVTDASDTRIKALKESTAHETFPICYEFTSIGPKKIGGFEELESHLNG